MIRHVHLALAWSAAWLAPSFMLAWILWATGQNPVSSLAYGWTGVAGAAGYVIVAGLLARRRRRQEFDEDVAAAWLSTPHEGLARMHADIVRDEERRRDE